MLKHLQQLASESFVYGLSGVAARFISIFLIPLYTRIFTPKDYGVMSLLNTTLALTSVFVVLAMDNSAHRWYWDTEDMTDRKCTLATWAWCQTMTTVVVASLMAASAGSLAKLIVGDRGAGVYFQIAAVSLLLGILNNVVIGWLRMQRRPWATSIITLTTSLAQILAAVVLVGILRQGVKGVFWSQAIQGGVTLIIGIVLMRDWLSPRWIRQDRLREMLRFALPLIPAGLAFWVVNLSDRYFVNFYASTSEVGLYAVGSSIAALVALATGAFQQAWGPFALSIHKEPKAREVYGHTLLAYLWVTCAISTSLHLLAPEAIRLVATPKYLGASSVVGLLALGYVMIGLQYVAAIGPAIVKDPRPIGMAALIGAGLNVVANFLLVPFLGKIGSAIATLLSQAAVAGYLFYRAQKLYPIPYRFRPAMATVALSLVLMWVGQGLHFARWWQGVLVKVGLAALFIPALFAFGIVSAAQARRFVSVSLQKS